jgi:sulfite exporter TauE/SafE
VSDRKPRIHSSPMVDPNRECLVMDGGHAASYAPAGAGIGLIGITVSYKTSLTNCMSLRP